jgi:hypothetical protein
MDVDAADVDSVRRFIEKWGMPFHPCRNDAQKTRKGSRASDAIKLTERLINEYHKMNVEELPDGSIRKTHRVDSPSMCISFEEAALTITELKTIAESIQRYLLAGLPKPEPKPDPESEPEPKPEPEHESEPEPEPPDLSLISLASCHRLLPVIQGHYQNVTLARVERNLLTDTTIGDRCLANRGLLTSAICNQALDTLGLEQPWRKCEANTSNIKCNTVFKQKNSLRLTKDERFADSRYSKYCSDRCYERQSKSNKSESAKNRVDHGTTRKGNQS